LFLNLHLIHLKVTFKVLAVNGKPYVNIGENQYEMTLKEYPLYKAEVEVNEYPVIYNYGINYDDGTAAKEAFSRKRNQNEKSLNEFFDRQVTTQEHPPIPKAYEPFEFYKPSKLYDETFVDTIIVNCNPLDLQQMYFNPVNKTLETQAEVIYASPYTVKTFKQASFSISGQSTRKVPKLSYKIKDLKTEDNKELYSRTSIKLRAEHMDPSFMRDKIYSDILNSLGVPAAQNKFARLFINGEAVGLFVISDDISNSRYLRETFNKGEKFTNIPSLFKADYCAHCAIGCVYGDLGYHGENTTDPMYSIYMYKGKDKTIGGHEHVVQEILPLIKDINAYQMRLTEVMPLDIDTFLKYMAVEFLAGAIDNFWSKPGNYFLFRDNDRNQWYFHDADFHFTFGVGGQPDKMLNTPLNLYPPGFDNVTTARPPLDAILSRPDNASKFNEIFHRLFSTSFHTGSIFPRIDSMISLIREDADWDFGIPRVSQALDQIDVEYDYKIDDFLVHTTGMKSRDRFGDVPIRFFIYNKIKLLSEELNIQIPSEPLNDLGYVEYPKAEEKNSEKNKDESGTLQSISWSIFSALIILYLSYILL